MSKMRNVDAGGDLPGVRIPDQPCQEKENDEEKHLSPYKGIKKWDYLIFLIMNPKMRMLSITTTIVMG